MLYFTENLVQPPSFFSFPAASVSQAPFAEMISGHLIHKLNIIHGVLCAVKEIKAAV